jgi:hypothetical protein
MAPRMKGPSYDNVEKLNVNTRAGVPLHPASPKPSASDLHSIQNDTRAHICYIVSLTNVTPWSKIFVSLTNVTPSSKIFV